MATDRTAILTIVIRATVQAQAETVAQQVDPVGGAGTFDPGVPLRAATDTSNTITHYWARWNMTPAQQADFGARIGSSIIAPGDTPRAGRSVYLFDSTTGWTPEEVLRALGLAVLIPTEP